MKDAKVFYTETGTDYYFIGYSEDEELEFIQNHPPKCIRTSKTTWSRSYTACYFEDPEIWNKYWILVARLKKGGFK